MNHLLNRNRYSFSALSNIDISENHIHIIAIMISVLYASILSNLPLMDFLDRVSYINYTKDSMFLLTYNWDKGFTYFFSNEPIWLAINIGLSTFFSSEDTLKLIIFMSSFLCSLMVLKSKPRQLIWLILILLFPQVIKNYIIHIRQGLAISFFLLGWFSHSRFWKQMLLIITPLIHSSFFFILVLLFINKRIKKLNISIGSRFLVICIFCGILVLTIQLFLPYSAARQVDGYTLMSTSVSGFGFIFWIVILFIMFLQNDFFFYNYSFESSNIVLYLMSYYVTIFTVRVFESSIVLILLCLLELSNWRRKASMILLSFFVIISYAMKWNQPYFGFGLEL